MNAPTTNFKFTPLLTLFAVMRCFLESAFQSGTSLMKRAPQGSRGLDIIPSKKMISKRTMVQKLYYLGKLCQFQSFCDWLWNEVKGKKK